MHYGKIEIWGKAKNHAILARKYNAEFIEAEVVTSNGTESRRVSASNEDELRAFARRLQQDLDGYAGPNGDIEPYASALNLLAP